MAEYLKSLAPRCLYSVVVYVSLIAAVLFSPYAIVVLAIVSANRAFDEFLLYLKSKRVDSDLLRIDRLETEVKQLNLAISFKNLHK